MAKFQGSGGESEKPAGSKAAIYIRVSTQWQVDKDSLQVQRRELIAYADMVLGIKEYIVFEDPGYSAKNTDRPDFQNMMARIRCGEFTHLLVWKIDRISRNLLDFTSMYSELRSLGVTFVSKNEQFDTSSAIGEAMLKIILVFAELERKMTAERVTAVMISRANNGQWNGGRVPYAYSWDKNTKEFTIIDAERKVYERIVELYEQGQSLLQISRYLNSKGITTRSGNEWSTQAVYLLLTNPWYVGDYRYNTHSEGNRYEKRDKSEWIIAENHHEAIIDRFRYDRLQSMLIRNSRNNPRGGKAAARTSKHIHIFAGLLTCGECGSNMTATLDKLRVSGWRPSAYGCAVRRKKSDRCQSKFITDVTLGPFVFNFISNLVRARGRIGERSTPKQIQQMLLAGDTFDGVTSIDTASLLQLKEHLLSGDSGVEYQPRSTMSATSPEYLELQSLRDRKHRYEAALGRLKSLYLYSDNSMPEKDYIFERQKIMIDLEATEHRIAQITADGFGMQSDDDQLIDQASYFVMAQRLLSEEPIDYGKFLSKIDPSIPRAFLRSVIREITIKNGLVETIEFRNGIKCIFTR